MKKLPLIILFLIPLVGVRIQAQLIEHQLPLKKPYAYPMAYLEHQPVKRNKAPILIFLHGIGEGSRSGPLIIITRTGLPRLIASNKMPVDSFIVLCPQGPKYISTLALKAFISYVKKTYCEADTSRVYLTGLSGGAITGARYCKDFKVNAAVLCAGYPNTKEMYKSSRTPMWLFHGMDDNVVPYKGDVNFVNAYKKYNPFGEILLTLYPGYGHNCWDITYQNPDIYYWMLKHK